MKYYDVDNNTNEWFNKYSDLFENSDYVKGLFLYVRKLGHDVERLTDFYADNYVPDINPWGSPFYYDVRNMRQGLDRWIHNFQQLYDSMEHKYEIDEMDILQTGGYVYVYVGSLKDHYWFLHTDDDIFIYDEKPLDPMDDDRDDFVWHKQHLVATLKPEEKHKYFYEQIETGMDKIVTNNELKESLHEHFNNLYKEMNNGIEQ